MSEIEKLDRNLAVHDADENGFAWYDCLESPFRVYGLIHTPEGFVRCPTDVAESVNDDLAKLNTHTAGGRVRFQSDSSEIAIRAHLRNRSRMAHCAITGSVGLDLYADSLYAGTFVPRFGVDDFYSATVKLKGSAMRDLLIHLPLYTGVVKLEIGIKEGSKLSFGKEYRIQKPVVYYGSSITQGGCASRPGNSYEAKVSRMLDCDHINLGFSGNATGDPPMAEYIAGLSMSAFVYDYDHNARHPEFLHNTHAAMFYTIREKNPDLPILLLSRPNRCGDDLEKNRAIIMRTYLDALSKGDKNVYFLDGQSMVRDGDGTVDGCHPNDLGFWYMAQAVRDLLERAWN